MEELLGLAKKILSQSATIHIYSFPHFTLEIFLAIVMFVIYTYLSLEVAQIAKRTLKMRPNTIIRKKLKEVNSTLSICTSTFSKYQETFNPYSHYETTHHPSTHLAYKRLSSRCSSHSQMGWIMPNMVRGLASSYADVNHSGDFESVASMTPKEFVKKEKERRLREKELQKCFESLTTLYDNVVERKYSVNTLQNKLDLAKETIQCSKCINPETAASLSADAMTNSLFDLLEKIVIPSSLNNPLPFKGDMTRLVLDAGDLNYKPQKSTDAIYARSSTSSTSSSEIIRIKTRNNITSC